MPALAGRDLLQVRNSVQEADAAVDQHALEADRKAWQDGRHLRAAQRGLAVGEDLDALDEAGGVGRGRGQRVGAVRVPDAEGDLDGLGVDEGRAAGQRDAADPRGCGGEGAQRAGEVLHVMPRRHVAGVACFQLVVQALHQLILGSGGDYLHACLYTRILTRTAKEKLFFQCLY